MRKFSQKNKMGLIAGPWNQSSFKKNKHIPKI